MIFHWVTLTGSVILLLFVLAWVSSFPFSPETPDTQAIFVFTTVVLGTGHYLCGGVGGIFFVLAWKKKRDPPL